MKHLLHTLLTAAAAIVLAHCTSGCLPPGQWAKDMQANYQTSLNGCLNLETKSERNACRVRVNTAYGLCKPPQYPEMRLCGETE